MYTQLAEIPVPTSAQFIPSQDPGQTIVQLNFSVKDHDRNVKRSMSKNVVFPSGAGQLENGAISTPLLDTDVVAQIVSPTKQKRATLRNVKRANGSSNRIVEVWNEGLLQISQNVTDYHGDFYTDEYVGSFSFAPSECAVVYTAEGNAPESKDPYSKFRFNPDFGEGLPGKKRPTTFILSWKDSSAEDPSPSKASLVQMKPFEGVRFGQAVFSPNTDSIIYATGYEFTTDGRFLGIKGCYNRPTGIWRLRIATPASSEITKPPASVEIVTAQKLTLPLLSCRSPRILNNNGKSTLLWLASRSGGAHVASSTLHSLDITYDDAESEQLSDSASSRTLVDIVEMPDLHLTMFPGLYPAFNLPTSFSIIPSDSASPSVLVASQWGSRTTVLAISTDTGAVNNLTPDSDNNLFSWTVLVTDNRSRVICSRSAPSVPYEIVIGNFDSSGDVSWNVIDRPALSKGVAKALSTIRASVIPIRTAGRLWDETIVLQEEKKEVRGSKPPCITSPHGGPHGTTSTAFSPNNIALVLEGYTLSLPNYTGSPGYGEKFIQDLIGRCGDYDVQNCIAAAEHLIKLGISERGPGKQFVAGGSHGGFLAAHLIGQFPDFFSAAVLRNPVISAGDISNTDIPDWYFSEFGLGYPISSSPISSYQGDSKLTQSFPSQIPPLVSVDAFAKLQAASPTAYLDDMKAPVLLLMGTADRRVAPAQGFLFYHALKARYSQTDKADKGAKVDILVFEGESHPLDGVEASRVSFEATRDWFKEARGAVPY